MEERRKKEIPVATERRKGGYHGGGMEQALTSTSESARQYTEDETEFIMAMDNYKRNKCRPFPSWVEVLGVIRKLGYRKQGQ